MCGVALVRLRKPLTYFQEKYGDPMWGLEKIYLLMEKQRNRGEDGVGIGVVKCNMPSGHDFLKRTRSNRKDALSHIFKTITHDLDILYQDTINDDISLKSSIDFLGEIYLGHLRYGTHSNHGVEFCQPYLYKNSIPSKSCMLIGNFNMANTKEQFNHLIKKGINLKNDFDTHIILNNIAHCLELEYNKAINQDSLPKNNNSLGKINIVEVIKNASQNWDGGYVFAGALGNGDSFICRDPAGIRPCFYYLDDEVLAITSERAALMSVFNASPDTIKPIKPGCVLIARQDNTIEEKQFTRPLPERQCTFERIYFSRINDPDIYQERKSLGKNLAQKVFEQIGNEIDNTIFAYVPNSGEAALIGLVEEIDIIRNQKKVDEIWQKISQGICNYEDLIKLSKNHSRIERLIYKDQILRTFITNDKDRNNLMAHIYDVTHGIVQPCNTLVVMDDSIVRGTTLRKSIMKQLSKLNPKHVIFVSSSPPIMYPDCYGIDMSQLGNFIAFQAIIDLLKEQGKQEILDQIAEKCNKQNQQLNAIAPMTNYVKELYKHFSLKELEEKIAQQISNELSFNGKISIIYQSIEGLHKALPNHHGDWYFTGDYPTHGGFEVLNRSYLKWYYGDNSRAY